MQALTNVIFDIVSIVLGILLLVCMIKAIIGPRVADRVVCVNMMGTIIMVLIAILAIKMKEGYLIDISAIYAMISFLAVVILCKVYMGVYLEKRERAKNYQEVDPENTNQKTID